MVDYLFVLRYSIEQRTTVNLTESNTFRRKRADAQNHAFLVSEQLKDTAIRSLSCYFIFLYCASLFCCHVVGAVLFFSSLSPGLFFFFSQTPS